VKIRVHTSSVTTSYDREEERSGSWKEHLDSSIEGVSIAEASDTIDCYDVMDADKVHVLYLRYSDGDSFGRCYGKLEVLWAFSSYSKADAAFAAMNEAIQKDVYSVEIENDFGKKVTLSNPCFDYFACADELGIREFSVGKAPNVIRYN
jgi:hypothetical protein